MKKFRRILFLIVLFSLLLVPYSFLAYLCYLGLCGGGESKAISLQFTAFYGYFSWIYLLTVILAVTFSIIFRNNINFSTFFLLFPVLGIVVLIYVEFQVSQIRHAYQASNRKSNQPYAEDYICSAGKYIRLKNKNIYYLYDYNNDGTSGSINAYYSLDELKKGLRSKSLDINKCYNTKHQTLT